MHNFIEDNNAVVSDNLNCGFEAMIDIKKVKPGKIIFIIYKKITVYIISINIVIYIVGDGANPSLPRCKKKKLLRLEKKLEKNPNSVPKTLAPRQKTLEDFIAENDTVSTNEVQKLRVRIYIYIVKDYLKTFVVYIIIR